VTAALELPDNTELTGDDWTDLPDFTGYHVYALYGADPNTPLYIGQSTNVLSRLGSHIGDPAKRAHVTRVAVKRCRSKFDMDATEQRLIAQYCPPWNTASLPAAERARRNDEPATPIDVAPAPRKRTTRWLAIDQVARRLDLSEHHVRQHIARGNLKASWVSAGEPRIHEESLAKFRRTCKPTLTLPVVGRRAWKVR
jgi:hypothetical protein